MLVKQLQLLIVFQEFEKEQCSIKPVDDVFISGLILEDAQQKKKCLTDLNFDQMNILMLVIHFLPLQQDKYSQRSDNYSCPVYKTQTRAGVLSTTGQSTNYVLAVDLPTLDQTPDYWTLRGTALICALKELLIIEIDNFRFIYESINQSFYIYFIKF